MFIRLFLFFTNNVEIHRNANVNDLALLLFQIPEDNIWPVVFDRGLDTDLFVPPYFHVCSFQRRFWCSSILLGIAHHWQQLIIYYLRYLVVSDRKVHTDRKVGAAIQDVENRFVHNFTEPAFWAALRVLPFVNQLPCSYLLFLDCANVTFYMRRHKPVFQPCFGSIFVELCLHLLFSKEISMLWFISPCFGVSLFQCFSHCTAGFLWIWVFIRVIYICCRTEFCSQSYQPTLFMLKYFA